MKDVMRSILYILTGYFLIVLVLNTLVAIGMKAISALAVVTGVLCCLVGLDLYKGIKNGENPYSMNNGGSNEKAPI